jgi:hypothetical protein
VNDTTQAAAGPTAPTPSTTEIKSIAGCVLYTSTIAASLREAVIEAVEKKAYLSGADLGGADLSDAALRDADMGGVNLSGANLRGADLRGADMGGVNLSGANLIGANLSDADLRDADLGGANLGAVLAPLRDDVRAVLDAAPGEVEGLLLALREGRVNGSTYEGPCACLVGTIAKVRGVHYLDLGGLEPDATRLAERWFLRIRTGDTPETSPDCAIAAAWVEGWLRERAAAAPAAAEATT